MNIAIQLIKKQSWSIDILSENYQVKKFVNLHFEYISKNLNLKMANFAHWFYIWIEASLSIFFDEWEGPIFKFIILLPLIK